jgi:hypothetical protein
MFSAYDIKKIVPRAIFALVAINLSWSLMDIFINMVDALGMAVGDLILAPFEQGGVTGLDLRNTSAAFSVALALLIAFAIGSAGTGLIPVIGVIVLGATGITLAFVITMVRRVALIGLVLIAPVAIAAGILPQTEGWFKKWWDWFSKLLLMYPFLMAFFALSKVASGLISRGGSSGIEGLAYQIAAVSILVAPYFLVGKAFSLAGGTIGKLAGMVNNKDKGVIDRAKKWEGQKVAERRSDAKAGGRYKDNAFTRPLNRGLRRVMNPSATLSPTSSGRAAATMRAEAAAAAKLEEMHPEIKNLSKEELALAATGSEKAANDYIDMQIEEKLKKDPTLNVATERQKWAAAKAGVKAKAGSFDSVLGAYAMPKAIAAGAIKPEAAKQYIDNRVSGAVGMGSQGTALTSSAEAQAYAGLGESGNAFAAQLARDGKIDLLSKSPVELTDVEMGQLHETANKLFQGDSALSYEQLGKINVDSANRVLASKSAQVGGVLAAIGTSGVPAGAQEVQDLINHRTHLLTMAKSARQEKNAQVVDTTQQALAELDQELARAAGIDSAVIIDRSTDAVRDKMGS